MGILWSQQYLGQFTDTYGFTFTARFNLNYWPFSYNTNHPTNTYKSFTFDTTNAPKNTTITCNGSTITFTNPGNISVDEYHSVGAYVSPYFAISSDMMVSPEILSPLTMGEFKSQVMHYTGKSWTYKGINAYYRDGHRLYFSIPISVQYTCSNTGSTIHTTSQTFTIQCVPNYSPALFKRKYAMYNS